MPWPYSFISWLDSMCQGAYWSLINHVQRGNSTDCPRVTTTWTDSLVEFNRLTVSGINPNNLRTKSYQDRCSPLWSEMPRHFWPIPRHLYQTLLIRLGKTYCLWQDLTLSHSCESCLNQETMSPTSAIIFADTSYNWMLHASWKQAQMWYQVNKISLYFPNFQEVTHSLGFRRWRRPMSHLKLPEEQTEERTLRFIHPLMFKEK